ncbi:TPA: hypothetical protein HA219_04195 [Candidatus Woesearchaeota archaeon]|nr:hypothetical protein [uncultured archaeon]AQS32060.1 hypothetical protein [uncultured archaeon]MBS3115253.1 hypothetical protein [Candidatus Woesearchaeota archaeon]HIH39891.1 hypothetical protein [Candidatus Woesearchaeota archaeon]
MDNDRDLNSLKNELNQTDKKKEELFAQSKENRNKFSELMSKINILKKERNSLTDSVKKIKSERDELNNQLKAKIEAFKKIAPKKKEKPKVHVNAGFLKKEIKAMEYKVETEGLSFDKEQKLMKIIKEKRKQLEESGPNAGLKPEARKLSDEIDSIRAKADEKHKEMRSKADESQKKHEEVISSSNQMIGLSRKQKEIENGIRESKKKIEELNQSLGNKLEQAVSKKKEYKPREYRRERRKDDRKYHSPKVNIEEMQHKAEEKLKKGGKLTTQDLMAFQNKK